MKTIYEQYLEVNQLDKVLKTGDYVSFNGVSFSDAEFFMPSNHYRVSDVEEIGFAVEVGIEGKTENIFIYPDGQSSFVLVKRES